VNGAEQLDPIRGLHGLAVERSHPHAAEAHRRHLQVGSQIDHPAGKHRPGAAYGQPHMLAGGKEVVVRKRGLHRFMPATMLTRLSHSFQDPRSFIIRKTEYSTYECDVHVNVFGIRNALLMNLMFT
jgi:hypothetical protein